MATVTVSTVWPVIAFASGVAGADTIYVSGTTIDSSLLSAVESAAAAQNVSLTVGTPASLPSQALLTVSMGDARYEPIGSGPLATIDGGSP